MASAEAEPRGAHTVQLCGARCRARRVQAEAEANSGRPVEKD
jgi:hypothetical protein